MVRRRAHSFQVLLFFLASLMATDAVAQESEVPNAPRVGVFPNEALEVKGEERRFRLVVPQELDLEEPTPLMIAFHGMLLDSKDVMPAYTKLHELAERKQFIIAFPQALEASWGIVPTKVRADLAFFDALVRHLTATYRIDRKRLYVVGMSNGGYFAHLVGRKRSNKIAAVVSHSGPLGVEAHFGIRSKRKFPVMIVHGEKDKVFPIAIAENNRDRYREEGHPVEYVAVPNLGHSWAGKSNINNSIWEFLSANPLKK